MRYKNLYDIPKGKGVYPRLEEESRLAIPTSLAAHYLNRQPQTLRSWACYSNGPIQPVRINGRLAWSVSDIKSLLKGGE